MYLLIAWEDRTGRYLARGPDPARVKCFPLIIIPAQLQPGSKHFITTFVRSVVRSARGGGVSPGKEALTVFR